MTDDGALGSPVVIWGAGAIGGTLGAHFVDAGRDVVLVDTAVEHVEAMNDEGLRITGPVAELRVPVRAVLPEALSGRHRTILLCVKAHHTARAVDRLALRLADDGCVVSVQNGLNERLIAARVGEGRTVGCFVNFGADRIEPGVVHLGGRGAVVVGELDGRESPRARGLHDLLRTFEPDAVLTGNIGGYLWGKLAYGALLFATALTDAPIADVLDSEEHRPALVALAREVVRVADARGVEPEAFDGFDPAAYRPGSGDAAARESLDALVAFNRRSAKERTGIWRDLAVRKRKTEVDAQLAPVAELGADAGVGTPLVRRLVELIHEIEEGEREQGWPALDALAAGAVDAADEA